MRESVCEGSYYSKGDNTLKQELESHYHHERGPGTTPSDKQDRNVVGIIAPNSPYAHCGPCAAWSYKALAETPMPDLYIILSANHHTQESGITAQTFITSLGMVRVDQEFARGLVEKGTIAYDDSIHEKEHGIEIQLPYLQYAKQKEVEKIKILPLLISSDMDIPKLALDIKETLVEQGKRAIVIVSSDFLRHGPLFHFVSFLEDTQKKVYEFDARGIDMIKAQNADGWAHYVEKSLAPIDGMNAITLLLKLLKPCSVELDQYYTSADILNEQKNSVSYAAIVFEEK